jgi:phosphoribosylformylglycinamidine synthase
MVAVVRPEMLDALQAVCTRWELPCTVIGEVTDSGALRAFYEGELVGDIPAELLTDECPRYEVELLPAARPLRHPEVPEFDVRDVIEQYDHLVGSRTVRRPGLDAAVLRLRPSMRGLAVALQGPALGESDGFRAGLQATLGAARNVACAGGDPEKPEIAWELAQAIEGIAQAAEALGIPVVSGNVSLYNDADGASIPPTPVVGCVGLVPDVRKVPGRWQSGDAVLLATSPEGSVAAEAALIRFLWKAAKHLSLCHDVGSSGISAALAEAAAWSGGLEAQVEVPDDYDSRRGAAILACRPSKVKRLGKRGFVQIGVVA